MKNTTHLRTGRHCAFNLHAHLVFVTKYRKALFSPGILKYLRQVFESICEMFESELIEFNGEKDHVHLLVHYPTKVSISKLVNSLKGVSSRFLRKEYSGIRKKYWKGGFWSPSYFAASCGGAPLEITRKYIEDQQIDTQITKSG